MPVFTIHHITKYQYDNPVKESVNEIRLFPRTLKSQEILSRQFNISNDPDLVLFNDYWDNQAGTFNLLHAHDELTIESKVVIRTLAPNLTLEQIEPISFALLKTEVNKALKMIELSMPDADGQMISSIIQHINPTGDDVLSFIQASVQYVFDTFKYVKGITNVSTTVEEILKLRSGVCQDFAHVLLEILRYRGIPSRYVSGYICPNKDGLRGVGATHAWVDVWLPDAGWIGFDPTNNLFVTDGHISLAVGRNFSDCTPLKGSFKGPARQKLSAYVAVGYEDGTSFDEVNDVMMVDYTDETLNNAVSAGSQQQ